MHEIIIGQLGITAENITVLVKGWIIKPSIKPIHEYGFFAPRAVIQVVVSLKITALGFVEDTIPPNLSATVAMRALGTIILGSFDPI